MKDRRLWLLIGVVVLLLIVVASASPAPVARSTWSGHGDGYQRAYDVLEASGLPVERWQRPIDELPEGPSTLVWILPDRLPWSSTELEHVTEVLDAGGRVVLWSRSESMAMDTYLSFLDLTIGLMDLNLRPTPSLWIGEWLSYSREPLTTPLPELGTSVTYLPGPLHHTTLPPAAVYGAVEGEAPVLQVHEVRGGEVWWMRQSDAFTNGRLQQDGNLHLLLAMFADAPGPIRFEEYHQGFSDLADAGPSPQLKVGRQLAIVGLLIYLLVVWMQSRAFGARLPQLQQLRSRVRTELMAVARIHDRSGHAPEAGQRMLDIARRQTGDPELPDTFSGGEDDLVALAEQVTRAQQHAPRRSAP